MYREKLVLNGETFIVDYYNSGEDSVYTKFVFLRNYEIVNGIIRDKDIYIIEKSLYLETINDIAKTNNKLNDNIIYPILNKRNKSFSNNYELFNGLFVDNSLYNINKDTNDVEIGDDVYLFYDKNGIEKNIKCDKIKIYKPHTIDISKCIIHISNYINGINFHYFCRQYNKYKPKLDNLFNINNMYYSEYISILLPNIDDLFEGNTYFNENLNNIISDDNSKFVETITESFDEFDIYDFSIFLYPYSIEVENGVYKKKLFKSSNKNILLKNSNIYPLKISLYKYSSISDTTFLYLPNGTDYYGDTIFIRNNSVELINKLGFNDIGKISVLSKIKYNNIGEENENKFSTYCKYYKINPAEYVDYSIKILDNIRKDFCSDYNYDFEDLFDKESQAYKKFKVFLAENEEEISYSINFVGYNIIFTSDINGKNILYEFNYPLKFNNITEEEKNDLSEEEINKIYGDTNMNQYLSIFNIFDSWYKLPDKLYIYVTFIDRYIGNVIKGNKICMTKEWFKYIISDTNIYKLKTLEDKSKNMVEINLTNNSSEQQDLPLFVNNINCVIKKDSEEYLNYKNKNTPRVLYKPYFYKVQDLQKIYLRSGLTQNIGINLNDYMTKVETFKLSIENLMYTEIGRNDAYVIFRVNASEIENFVGRYDIFNEEDEYISSGDYSIHA